MKEWGLVYTTRDFHGSKQRYNYARLTQLQNFSFSSLVLVHVYKIYKTIDLLSVVNYLTP